MNSPGWGGYVTTDFSFSGTTVSAYTDPLGTGPRAGRTYSLDLQGLQYQGSFYGYDFGPFEVAGNSDYSTTFSVDYGLTFSITVPSTTYPGMVQRSTVSSGALGSWPGIHNPEPRITVTVYQMH